MNSNSTTTTKTNTNNQFPNNINNPNSNAGISRSLTNLFALNSRQTNEEIALEKYKIDEILRKKIGGSLSSRNVQSSRINFLHQHPNQLGKSQSSQLQPMNSFGSTMAHKDIQLNQQQLIGLSSPKQTSSQSKKNNPVDCNNYYFMRSPQSVSQSNHRFVSSSSSRSMATAGSAKQNTLSNNLSSQSLILKSPMKRLVEPLRFFASPQQQQQESQQSNQAGAIFHTEQGEMDQHQGKMNQGQKKTTAMIDRIYKEILAKSPLFSSSLGNTESNNLRKHLPDQKCRNTNDLIQIQAEEFQLESMHEPDRQSGMDQTTLRFDSQRGSQIEFCLAEVMERLEKEIVEPMLEVCYEMVEDVNVELPPKGFEKKYLKSVVKIVNESIVSILLRVGAGGGGHSGQYVRVFLEYMNSFLSWFLSAVEEEFDKKVGIKVEQKCEQLYAKIESYEDELLRLKREVEERDNLLLEMERTISNLKAVYTDEKNGLLREILALEEKIEEVTNVDNKENAATESQLKDNLCSLGFSIMARGKHAVERDNQARRDFNLFRLKDDSIMQSFNDHPFLTAFIYNRFLGIEVSVRDIDSIESRLIEFFTGLDEDDLNESDCSDLFMEFVLSKCSSQQEGFVFIESTVRYFERERMKPFCSFFIKFFGILGASTPNRLAMKEILRVIEKLNLQKAENDLIGYTADIEMILVNSLSSSDVVRSLRVQYSSVGSRKFEKWSLLSSVIVAVSNQDDLDSSEDIYNLISVSSQETVDSFGEKLNYQLIKKVASSINVKPFAFLNHLLSTFERYSKDRKKDQVNNPGTNSTSAGNYNNNNNSGAANQAGSASTASKGQLFINSSQIPKAMRDSFISMMKFNSMIGQSMKSIKQLQQQQQDHFEKQQSILSGERMNSYVFDGESIPEKPDTHRDRIISGNQTARQQDSNTNISSNGGNAGGNKKAGIAAMKKVQNSFKLTRLKTSQKNEESSLDSSVISKLPSSKRANNK